jgi:uncharacterized protein YpmB
MEKLKEILIKLNDWKKAILIVLIIFIVGIAFYWFEIRPSRIYSNCNNEAKNKVAGATGLETAGEFKDYYDLFYWACLRNKGINK